MPTLTACALSARDLPHTDRWPKDTRPDAYVEILVGGTSCRSAIINNDDHPTWDHCCDFGCAAAPCTVSFNVFDKDQSGTISAKELRRVMR